VSCLPTGASGTVFEINTGHIEAAVVAGPYPVLPGEPEHAAAATASTTLSEANKTRVTAGFLAGRPALSWAKPPAEVTRRCRRLPSQDQVISSHPSQWAWYGHSKQERASAALTRG
jgi:hypothetical protein